MHAQKRCEVKGNKIKSAHVNPPPVSPFSFEKNRRKQRTVGREGTAERGGAGPGNPTP